MSPLASRHRTLIFVALSVLLASQGVASAQTTVEPASEEVPVPAPILNEDHHPTDNLGPIDVEIPAEEPRFVEPARVAGEIEIDLPALAPRAPSLRLRQNHNQFQLRSEENRPA
jgi:hypothetical protein